MDETGRLHTENIQPLIERLKQGDQVPLTELVAICPYRTLMGPTDELHPDAVPDISVVVLGFVPEDFSTEMRDDIVSELMSGSLVELLSNDRALRDYAKREIALTLLVATTEN
jgi:hypothetical protein